GWEGWVWWGAGGGGGGRLFGGGGRAEQVEPFATVIPGNFGGGLFRGKGRARRWKDGIGLEPPLHSCSGFWAARWNSPRPKLAAKPFDIIASLRNRPAPSWRRPKPQSRAKTMPRRWRYCKKS